MLPGIAMGKNTDGLFVVVVACRVTPTNTLKMVGGERRLLPGLIFLEKPKTGGRVKNGICRICHSSNLQLCVDNTLLTSPCSAKGYNHKDITPAIFHLVYAYINITLL
jgi:hypothetical protein